MIEHRHSHGTAHDLDDHEYSDSQIVSEEATPQGWNLRVRLSTQESKYTASGTSSYVSCSNCGHTDASVYRVQDPWTTVDHLTCQDCGFEWRDEY